MMQQQKLTINFYYAMNAIYDMIQSKLHIGMSYCVRASVRVILS